MQDANAVGPLAAAKDIAAPAEQAIDPAAADEDAADGVDDADEEPEGAVALLAHGQQDGLDVEFEEDAGHVALADFVLVRRHGVLVREDRVGRGRAERGVLRRRRAG